MSRPSAIVAAVILCGVLAVLVWGSARPPAGAVEPQWDHARCARCGMLVSEPRFAAQLQRPDGRVLFYDDPGCLLVHDPAERGELADAHAVYFRHVHEARWLGFDEAGFVPAETPTPMDFGFAAVARSERPDALGPLEVRARLLAPEEGQRGHAPPAHGDHGEASPGAGEHPPEASPHAAEASP